MSNPLLPNFNEVNAHFNCLTHTNKMLSNADLKLGLLLCALAQTNGDFEKMPLLSDVNSVPAKNADVFEGQKDNWTHFLAQDYLIMRLTHMEFLLSSTSVAILQNNTFSGCVKQIQQFLKEDADLTPPPLIEDERRIGQMRQWHFSQNCYADALVGVIAQNVSDITNALCDSKDYKTFQLALARRKRVEFPLEMNVPVFKSIPSKAQQNEHIGMASETGVVAHDIKEGVDALYKSAQVSAKYKFNFQEILRTQREY